MNSLIAKFSMASAVPLSTITGQITDSAGAPISKAKVIVHWDPSGSDVGLTDNIGTKQDATVFTDKSGHYSVKVPTGFYDVFVSAMAFTPSAAKVRVREGHPGSFSAMLNGTRLSRMS